MIATARVLAVFATLTGLALVPAHALAQGAGDEARERFARGVELYDEGHHAEALAELERAYQLAPEPDVLFHIAQAHAALGQPVEAVDALERYLAEGGASISTSRRAEVEEELARQRARIASLIVEADVLGAIVSIDDLDVGTTPLAGHVRVSAGEHVVAARAPGYATVRRRVSVAGGAEELVRIELLERTPGAQQTEGAASDAQHTAGIVAVVAGGLLAAAGVTAVALNHEEWEELDRERALASALCGTITPECRQLFEPGFSSFDQYESDLDRRRRLHTSIDIGAAFGVGVGAALLVVGTILVVTTPSRGDSDRSASARVELGVGPGSLSLHGTF